MAITFVVWKTEAIALPGLTAGWQAGWWNSAKFRNLKLYTGWNIQIFLVFDKGTLLL